MAARKSEVRRKTKETDITLSLALEGAGAGAISMRPSALPTPPMRANQASLAKS